MQRLQTLYITNYWIECIYREGKFFFTKTNNNKQENPTDFCEFLLKQNLSSVYTSVITEFLLFGYFWTSMYYRASPQIIPGLILIFIPKDRLIFERYLFTCRVIWICSFTSSIIIHRLVWNNRHLWEVINPLGMNAKYLCSCVQLLCSSYTISQ